MAVVAKKDIETLTKQLLQEKFHIFETIKQEYVEIDPSLLHECFVQDLEKKLTKINETQPVSTDDPPISLDDLEMIVGRFDSLDKTLSEPKVQSSNIIARKESNNMKRFVSMNDINKTLVRTLSSQSLNSTIAFVQPQAPAPRSIHNHNMAITSSNTNKENPTVTKKLTWDDLIKHNSISSEVQMHLDSIQLKDNSYKKIINDISLVYMVSFDRLTNFFDEVQKIQLGKTVEFKNNVTLEGLDTELLNLMEKSTKVLHQIRFIAKNQNIYSADGIKSLDPLLSDDLTDILEHFYRAIK